MKLNTFDARAIWNRLISVRRFRREARSVIWHSAIAMNGISRHILRIGPAVGPRASGDAADYLRVIPGLLSARLVPDSDNSMQVGRGVNIFVQ
jgi:hypothetical protein